MGDISSYSVSRGTDAGGRQVGEGQWAIALTSSVETPEITLSSWGTLPPFLLPHSPSIILAPFAILFLLLVSALSGRCANSRDGEAVPAIALERQSLQEGSQELGKRRGLMGRMCGESAGGRHRVGAAVLGVIQWGWLHAVVG